MFDLTGKVAIVTGASGDIGKALAMAYAKSGADLVLLDRRLDRLEVLAEEIKKTGRDALAIQVDLTIEKDVKETIEKAYAHYGHLDILMNGAGACYVGAVDSLSVEDFDASMDVNLKTMFLASKYTLKYMLENKYGKIVNIASLSAVLADKEDTFVRHAYCTSKTGVVGLTKSMAATYAKHNITVNAIGPGVFNTEMTRFTLFEDQDFIDYHNSICPASRTAEIHELDGTVIYLSSDASSYVTGQFITIDGGVPLV
ncbi:MAG: SDR family NAD(P)-dependent oxidoreductase, partial [Lachnospirales bacterium]